MVESINHYIECAAAILLVEKKYFMKNALAELQELSMNKQLGLTTPPGSRNPSQNDSGDADASFSNFSPGALKTDYRYLLPCNVTGCKFAELFQFTAILTSVEV